MLRPERKSSLNVSKYSKDLVCQKFESGYAEVRFVPGKMNGAFLIFLIYVNDVKRYPVNFGGSILTMKNVRLELAVAVTSNQMKDNSPD